MRPNAPAAGLPGRRRAYTHYIASSAMCPPPPCSLRARAVCCEFFAAAVSRTRVSNGNNLPTAATTIVISDKGPLWIKTGGRESNPKTTGGGAEE